MSVNEPGVAIAGQVLGDSALLRKLGFWALAASIINITVGSGIFALPGTLAGILGAAAPLAFLLGALVFIPITMCFAAAGSRVLAAWQLQHRNQDDQVGRERGTPFVLRGGPLIPLIGCTGIVLILCTLRRQEWLAIGYALAAVIALYAIVRGLRGSKPLPDHG